MYVRACSDDLEPRHRRRVTLARTVERIAASQLVSLCDGVVQRASTTSVTLTQWRFVVCVRVCAVARTLSLLSLSTFLPRLIFYICPSLISLARSFGSPPFHFRFRSFLGAADDETFFFSVTGALIITYSYSTDRRSREE